MQLQLSSFATGEWRGCVEQFPSWIDQGIRHGFFGVIDNYSTLADADKGEISDMPWGSPLHLLNQVHGEAVVDHPPAQTSGQFPVADGWILPMGFRGAFAIKTADCVPILARCGTQLLAIHAGWRGIAAGILLKALDRAISRVEDFGDIEVILGPCAGAERYEVNKDVLDAIGPIAAARGTGHGRYLLDLRGTITRQLETLPKPARSRLALHASQICTISDTRFHSYRREGAGAGRNLSVVW